MVFVAVSLEGPRLILEAEGFPVSGPAPTAPLSPPVSTVPPYGLRVAAARGFGNEGRGL